MYSGHPTATRHRFLSSLLAGLPPAAALLTLACGDVGSSQDDTELQDDSTTTVGPVTAGTTTLAPTTASATATGTTAGDDTTTATDDTRGVTSTSTGSTGDTTDGTTGETFEGELEIHRIGRYAPQPLADRFDQGAAEISAFDPISQSLFVTNGMTGAIDVLDLSDPDGTQLSSVTVGVLPDMVTWSPDGSAVLTANEGEPPATVPASSIPRAR